MKFSLTTAVVFALALAALADSDQQYRLARTQYTCGGSHRPPAICSETSLLEIDCGDSKYPLKASFSTNYRDTGLVDFTSTATGVGSNTVKQSTVVVGSGTGKCGVFGQSAYNQLTQSIPFNGISFSECGFDQTMDGNLVHRTIQVKLRHRFNTGERVDFICYRDITVDFWLTPINPPPQTLNPPIPQVEDDLNVCIELKHQLTVLDPKSPYFWHFKVTTKLWDVLPSFGLGFKLQKCWVKPYLRNGGLGRDVVFLENGDLDTAVLFGNSAPLNEAITAGKIYEFSVGQITDGLLNDAQLHKDKLHQVHCNVCLCSLHGPNNLCPRTMPIRTLRRDSGRGGFEDNSIRPLHAEAMLLAGYVREVQV